MAHRSPEERGDGIFFFQVYSVSFDRSYVRQDYFVHLEWSDGLEWNFGDLELRALY